MKKTLTILFIVGASFFGVNLVQATTLYSTYDPAYSDTTLCQQPAGCDSATNGSPYQEITVTKTGYLNNVYVNVPASGTYHRTHHYFNLYSDAGVLLARYYASTTPNYLVSWVIHFTPIAPASTSPYLVTAGTKYRFQEVCDPSECGSPFYPSEAWLAKTPSTTYPDNIAYADGARDKDSAWDWTIADSLSGSEISVAFDTSAICDFSYFKLDYTLSDSDFAQMTSTENWSVGVNWSRDGGINDPYYVPVTQIAWINSLNGQNAERLIPKLAPWIDTTTVWYVSPFICSKDSLVYCDELPNNPYIIARGVEQQFIVNPVGTCTSTWFSEDNPKPPIGGVSTTPDSTLQNISDNMCNDLGAVTKPLCQALKYLFFPSQSSIDNFISLKSEVQNKPPFGYVTAYITPLQNLSTSTATTSVDFSFATNLNFFGTLRDIFIWAFWLTFGFWVVNRFRNFYLDR